MIRWSGDEWCGGAGRALGRMSDDGAATGKLGELF